MSWHSAVALSILIVAGASAQQQPAGLAGETNRREAMQHYRDGQELFNGEQFEAAAEQFRRAIAKDRLLTIAHYSLGQSMMRLQRYAGAIQAYEECLEAFKTLHGLAQANRIDVEKQRDDEIRELKDNARRMRQQATEGSGLGLKAMQTDERVADLERQKTSVDGPFQPPAEVLLALGSAHFRNGDRDAAETAWKSALRSNPKLGEAHNNLAVIYMQSGRLDEAEAELKLAEKNGFRVNPQFKADLKAKRKER